jgi:hypothetical protein
MDEFPFPQTLGKTRGINTVAADPNTGLDARPIQYEPQSLITQTANYVNNWLGNLTTADQVKSNESLIKAGKIGSIPTGFQTFMDTFQQSSAKFSTFADEIFAQGGYTVSQTSPGAKVPGRPVAPPTTQYQYPNRIDQSLKNAVSTGQEFVEQVKGLFNAGYDRPIQQKAIQASSLGSIGAAGGWPFLVVIAYLLWVS